MVDNLYSDTAEFDPHFKIFYDLMAFKVQEILLVSSPYDAFILEEDGSLAIRLINEYHGLNLSRPPRLTRVATASEAFELVREKKFDLVITMPFPGGMDASALGRGIKKLHPELPVVLLAHDMKSIQFVQRSAIGVDQSYLWCDEADLLLAIIKNVEDHRNVAADTERAKVRVILYVEDTPLHRSLFLPKIYQEVVRQTQFVLDESLNENHRLLKMRARPKILIAADYEEAESLYEAWEPFIFAVISDARYPKNGIEDGSAGIEFLRKVRRRKDDLPILLVSSEEENHIFAGELKAAFIDKNSFELAEDLHSFFLSYLGFGDFVFHLPGGAEIGRAANLHELNRVIETLPLECLEYHARRNHISNWVMARAEVGLARHLDNDVLGQFTGEALREYIDREICSLRSLRQKGVVVRFLPGDYDWNILEFVRIGSGVMGGKARGLAFIWSFLQRAIHSRKIPENLVVTIPKTCAVTAEGFDEFIELNNLYSVRGLSDDRVAALFQEAVLPQRLEEDLRAFLRQVHAPLSIRSSSLLEDGHLRPYAGLYSTYFLTNNQSNFEQRFNTFTRAIKLVFASTWFEGPRSFSRAVGSSRPDAMAVLVQQLIGRARGMDGRFWYPAVSGVAQSRNFYPVMGMKPEDGIVHIALGIGKTVVEGGKSLWFSPKKPKKLVQFNSVESILNQSQTKFYALDMQAETSFSPAQSNLVLRELGDAIEEEVVRLLCSTYIPEEHRIRDGDIAGQRVLTFASLLKYSRYPLGQILSELLELGKEGMGTEVEIEFAVDFDKNIEEAVFYLLQLRPMIAGVERGDLKIAEEERAAAVCRVSQVLGCGQRSFTECLYVRPETFNAGETIEMVREIGDRNRILSEMESPYLLIGPGRWGSADPWLGIPVTWADISGVGAIIEERNSLIRAEPSQGTHFFQNITSLNIPYLTLDGNTGDDYLHREWFAEQQEIWRGKYVSHFHCDTPLVLKCDGLHGDAVLFPKS